MTANQKTKVLVLGVSGMLGNAVLRVFAQSDIFSVMGSARSTGVLRLLPAELREHVICGVDVENTDSLMRLFTQARPDVVINCIGLVKQLAEAADPLASIPINALLPHRLAHMGWNDVQTKPGAKLFTGCEPQPRFYFLHSYFYDCDDKADVAATASYGMPFDCVVSRGHIHGVQCHPEKSHRFGAQLLKNFAEL